MLKPEDAVYTHGWTAGQRVNALREFVLKYGCESFFTLSDLMASDFFLAPSSTK